MTKWKSLNDIENMFVQFIGVKLPKEYSEGEKEEFVNALLREDIFTSTYSTFGIRKEFEILIFQMHRDLESLVKRTKKLLYATALGKKCEPVLILTGIIRKSRYGSAVQLEDYAIIGGSKRGKYLIVYPFTKTSDWYLLGFTDRAEMMREHIKVGRKYDQVKQLLAYSFGIDDQEFIVAYETDDIVVFQDLVMELRETQARRYTLKDTPIVTAIYSPPTELFKIG